MHRDITPANRATLNRIEAQGYRVGIGEQAGRWITTAKRDADGQFHAAKGEAEDDVVKALTRLVSVIMDD